MSDRSTLQVFRLSTLVACLCLPLVLVAAGDEVVVVDQGDFSAYWSADERNSQSLMLAESEGPERYGCIAMPFVIETDGRVSPGRAPLLAKVGQSTAGETLDVDGLYSLVMGTLPQFKPPLGTPPSDAIFSSRSIVFGDRRVRARLGEDKWAAVHDRLARECRIDQLATWMQNNDDATVRQSLPANPEQLLTTAN